MADEVLDIPVDILLLHRQIMEWIGIYGGIRRGLMRSFMATGVYNQLCSDNIF